MVNDDGHQAASDQLNNGGVFASFRTKMLGAFALSMLISGIATYTVYLALRQYYRTHVYLGDPLAGVRKWIAQIGDLNVFLILFIPLSIIIFYMITKPYVRHFRTISQGIHHLANSDFSRKVELNTNDELQLIAQDINRAAEKLQEAIRRGDMAERSKDQLVMNLAHDLRTPLTSVIGYLDYILQHDELDQERSKHFMTIAYTKSKRLESLIEQLFEITRMNYGHLSLNIQEIDLAELLSQLVEELYPLFEKYNLTTRLDMPARLPVEADGELLARVFENLLSNAARYGRDGQYVDLVAEVKEQEIAVQVINYGAMIDERELQHIFDIFYQGDQARLQHNESTGLGLFIAKNIVEQHKGHIAVSSDVTKTSFTVTIPLKQMQQANL